MSLSQRFVGGAGAIGVGHVPNVPRDSGTKRDTGRDKVGQSRDMSHGTSGTDVTGPAPSVFSDICRDIAALYDRVAAIEKQLDTFGALIGKAAVDVAPMKAAPGDKREREAARKRAYRERKGKA